MRNSSIFRSCSTAVMVVALATTVSACGGSAEKAGSGVIDKATLVDAMKKKSPEFKELPAATFDCMVGVLLKYGDQPTLQGIVDGKLDISNDFKAFGAKEKQVQREISDCG